jgi:hypothetical protein
MQQTKKLGDVETAVQLTDDATDGHCSNDCLGCCISFEI